MITRTAFFISDGTGITAETLGNSLLSQFEDIVFKKVTLPYINTPEKAQATVERINTAAENDGERPIIFDTIVNREISEILSASKGFKIDAFNTFLKPLEGELRVHSSYRVGKSHAIKERTDYLNRIESVNFALDNDDGARTQQYDKADIILIGVSRCGKTPTCLYMALQFGTRAANYPLIEEDLDTTDLPESLAKHRQKLFGLTIDPFQLASIRHERRPNSRYASLDQCDYEVRAAERIFRNNDIPFINSTNFSIEEISTHIIAETNMHLRNG